MKFYIASRLENVEQVQYLAGKLKAAGWIHTYDWTIHGSIREPDIDTLREIGQKEFDGVREADIVVILTPQGRGTHTELGMAMALGKRIYLCHTDNTYFKCDENTTAFYWLPGVIQIIGTTDDIIHEILRTNGAL